MPWITITLGSSGSGSGTIRYSVTQNTGSARTGTITLIANGQTRAVHTVNQSAAGPTNLFVKTKLDFNGDGNADVSVFRPVTEYGIGSIQLPVLLLLNSAFRLIK